jgi:photosystem II stability/assembly factor-like uncharacterized protein
MPSSMLKLVRLLPLILLAFLALAPVPAFAGVDRWTRYGPTGAGVVDVAVDPRSPNRLWISTGTVYKSEDGGATFQLSASGLEGQVIFRLAIDPSRPDVLYATVWDSGSGVFRSEDGGAHWKLVANLSSIWSLAVTPGPPGQPGIVFVGTDAKLYRSMDGGATFQPVITFESVEIFEAITADLQNPNIVYAATLYQRAKSTDYGTTWEALDEDPGNFPPFVHDMVAAPGDPQTIYETGDGANVGATWRSRDGGATWQGPFPFRGDVLAVDPGDSNTVYGGGIRGLFVSHDGGETFFEAVRGVPPLHIEVTGYYGVWSIQTDPARPGYAWAATSKGLFLTTNRGRTWQAVPMRNMVANPVGNFRIDPRDPSHWILSSLGSFFESHDGGRTFTVFADSLQRRASIYTLEFDPFVPGQLWALVYSSGLGMFVSRDGGATWFRLATEPPVGAQLLLPAPHVLLIEGSSGIWRSGDSGRTWQRVFPTGSVESNDGSSARLVQDPRHPSTIYWRGYRSDDLGRSWRRTREGAVAFDPFHPRTVHVAQGDTLLVSRDGGASFQIVGHLGLQGPPLVVDLLFDRVRRNVLYAVTLGDGVLRSRDGGVTWESLNAGLPPDLQAGKLDSLVQDPAYSHRFYLLPNTVGFWRADF